MRRAVLSLLLLLAAGLAGLPGAAQADAGPTMAEIDAALERAVAWLTEHARTSVDDCTKQDGSKDCPVPGDTQALEAITAAGLDPATWPRADYGILDTATVPNNTHAGKTHGDPTRELYGATHAGYNPRDFHGRDLWAQARGATDAVVESAHSGFLSFLLMTLVHDPDGGDDAARVAAALKAAQGADGGWNCKAAPNSDCTAFGIVALSAHGSLDAVTRERALGFLDAHRMEDGGYRYSYTDPSGESNVNSAAWALMAHRAVGREDDPDLLRYLLDMQSPEGWFYWAPSYRATDDDTNSMFATLEAITALAGGHPLPAFQPPDLPATASVGVPATLEIDDRFTQATWAFPGATLHGTWVTHTLPRLGDNAFHLAARGDGVQYRGPATVRATNAAPTVTLPGAIVADRTTPLHLDPAATDPDGHATTARYRLGDRSGTLPAELDLRGLGPGNHTLQVTVRDGWGGTAVATTPLTIHNLDPVIDDVTLPATVQAGRPFNVSLEGHDPDGPAPEAQWRLDDPDGTHQSGRNATWTLPEGRHVLTATLRDADGATAASRHTVRATAGPPPPQPAPTIADLNATANRTHLHVNATVDPPDATLRLEWVVDGVPYARDAIALPRLEPLPPGSLRVDAVRLTATTSGGEAHADAGPLPVSAPEPASEPDPEPALPRIEGLRLHVANGTLTVNATVQPPGARIDLTVRIDDDETIHHDITLPHALPLDPATGEVSIHLTATAGIHATTAELGPVPLGPPPQDPAPEPTAAVTTSTPGASLPLVLLAVAALATRRRP